ncbi:MAG: hypothetical protein QN162_14615 [Armatimonadota bacterium]|nr:hypothetical protein [Armatimonadota bacterium]
MAFKQPIEILDPKDGEFRTYPEASGATFKRGELVQLSSGRVADLLGTDPAANSILGIATHDASGTADSDVVVFVPSPDSLFVANLGGTSVTAATDRGAEYGLVEEANQVHVDKTDTTTTRVVVVDLDRRDPVGDTNGRVIFKFMASALDLSA